jgi:hypothetical protein
MKKRSAYKNNREFDLCDHLVEVKFNLCRIIPHYYNNKFALHMHTFNNSVLFLNTLNIAIH